MSDFKPETIFAMPDGTPSAALSGTEKRWAFRQSTKSPALIIITGARTVVQCMMTDTSSTGSMLEFDSAACQSIETLPETFCLQTVYDRTQVQCEIAWRDDTRVGVRFTSKMQSLPPRSKAPKVKEKPKSFLGLGFGRSR